MTEKEIEASLEFETRYLSVPEPCSANAEKPITVFKKKPVMMFKGAWEIYDALTEEPQIHSKTDLIRWAVMDLKAFDGDLGRSLHYHAATALKSYKETNLPILEEIAELRRELDELEKKDKDNDLN